MERRTRELRTNYLCEVVKQRTFSTHKGISFFYANARSIVNKVDMLHLEVANKVYDVVVLVETHLDSSIADGEFFFF